MPEKPELFEYAKPLSVLLDEGAIRIDASKYVESAQNYVELCDRRNEIRVDSSSANILFGV